MSKEVKRYAERDIMALDAAGNYYCRHVSAMTREGLHSKSDIAAELGWRDMQIDALLAERDALAKDAARWRHARSILTVDAIETAQSEYINFGLPPAESESIRADQAIDAALQGEQP